MTEATTKREEANNDATKYVIVSLVPGKYVKYLHDLLTKSCSNRQFRTAWRPPVLSDSRKLYVV